MYLPQATAAQQTIKVDDPHVEGFDRWWSARVIGSENNIGYIEVCTLGDLYRR